MQRLQELDVDGAVVDEVDETKHIEESSSSAMSLLKLAAASVFLWSAITTYQYQFNASSSETSFSHRRLTQVVVGDSVPAYMGPLLNELKERKKLMEETPPEEVKYWFEYTGPLQVSLSSARVICFV